MGPGGCVQGKCQDPRTANSFQTAALPTGGHCRASGRLCRFRHFVPSEAAFVAAMNQRGSVAFVVAAYGAKPHGQKWSETCFGFAEPMRVPMDAITQALPIFVDPASSLLPVEETNAAGGSLFGMLLATVVMGDAQQDETPLQPADAPIERLSAANNAPPPVLAHQWIAQLASMPELPTAF